MTWELTDRSDKGRTSASVERTDPQDWPYVIWTPFPPFALGESGLLASNERVAKFAAAAPDMYAGLEEAEDELDAEVSMLLDSYCLKLADGSYDRGVMTDCERQDLERVEQRLAAIRAALAKAGRA